MQGKRPIAYATALAPTQCSFKKKMPLSLLIASLETPRIIPGITNTKSTLCSSGSSWEKLILL